MELYRNLYEIAQNAMFFASPKGQIIDMNPAGLQLFGYTESEVLQLHYPDLFAKTDQKHHFSEMLNTHHSVTEFEAELLKNDGTTIECLISLATQRTDDDTILSYQGIIHDITTYKQDHPDPDPDTTNLTEHTTRLEAQIDQLTALNSMMQMVASGRDLQATLEIVAKEMVRLFNARNCVIALLSHDFSDLDIVVDYFHGEQKTYLVGTSLPIMNNLAYAQVVSIGETVVVSEAQTSPQTKPLHSLLQARNTQCLMIIPLLSMGKVIGTISVDIDNPDREFTYEEVALAEMIAAQIAGFIENVRLFDEDLHQAYQQLQELDKLKSAFIGVVTHELRSPFVAAELSAQLVERYAQHNMMDELFSQIKQLRKELAEGRKMIDSLVSFSSLMSKKRELYIEETNPITLIKQAVFPWEKIAKSRQIAIAFHFAPNLPLIYVDKEQLDEAISHLVHNAVRFSRPGGNIEISCLPGNDYIVIKVEDTGVGIPVDKLSTIWDAFTQNADDFKRGVEGLGLGLAVVNYVVKAHGGTVAASSTPKHGSVFGFRIPIKPKESG